MLSYDDCRKLKAAGYPQTTQFVTWITMYNEGGGMEVRRHFATPPADEMNVWLICPNSDELIAAIQARWPDVYSWWGKVLEDAMYYHGGEDSLLVTLAAFFIALAEGGK